MQIIHVIYNSNIRKVICVITSITILLCKISLQFCCELINNNRSNIFLIWNIARWIKFPTSILYIAYSSFDLYNLIKNRRKPNDKKELTKIIGKSASLASSTIEALVMLKTFNFLTGSNSSSGINNIIHLISIILFLFISEPIEYYYSYKKYHLANKRYQDACKRHIKGAVELTKYESELIKHKKNIFISTVTILLGLLNLVLKKIETKTTPINFSDNVIYNFNLSLTISIIYSAIFLAIHLNKLFNQAINDNPSTKLESTNRDYCTDNKPYIT